MVKTTEIQVKGHIFFIFLFFWRPKKANGPLAKSGQERSAHGVGLDSDFVRAVKIADGTTTPLLCRCWKGTNGLCPGVIGKGRVFAVRGTCSGAGIARVGRFA